MQQAKPTELNYHGVSRNGKKTETRSHLPSPVPKDETSWYQEQILFGSGDLSHTLARGRDGFLQNEVKEVVLLRRQQRPHLHLQLLDAFRVLFMGSHDQGLQ